MPAAAFRNRLLGGTLAYPDASTFELNSEHKQVPFLDAILGRYERKGIKLGSAGKSLSLIRETSPITQLYFSMYFAQLFGSAIHCTFCTAAIDRPSVNSAVAAY